MKRIASLLILFSVFGGLAAQNRISNGGFEAYSSAPTGYGQLCNATGWTSPSGYCAMVSGCGTPDLYNTQGTGGAQAPATWWANVTPAAGQGMAGFAAWYTGTSTFREYVMAGFNAPLVVGQAYTLTFWLNNAVSTIHPYGIDSLGIAFKTTPFIQSCGGRINFNPQLVLPAVTYSTTWQLHSFTFTATAAFQYLCIGNFQTYAGTVAQKIGTLGNSGAYYYIDEVSLQPAVPLPVELLEFTASAKSDRSVRLDWATATEQDNDHFDVQRSQDGVEFTTIASVAGAGTSVQEIHYSNVDPLPFGGINYYRLLQVDADGEGTYSELRSVELPRSTTPILAYPNPSSGSIELTDVDPDLTLSLVIEDMSGRVVFSTLLAPGQHVQVNDLSTGCYLLRTLDGTTPPQRLIVR